MKAGLITKLYEGGCIAEVMRRKSFVATAGMGTDLKMKRPLRP
jgi:hypothetical protein